MFVVSEADAAAIRTAYDQGGELSAAVELRRLFPGITDNAKARACARTIAGWQPLPPTLPVKKPRRSLPDQIIDAVMSPGGPSPPWSVLLLVRHQHGQSHVAQQLTGDAAQYEFSQARMTVAANNQQIGTHVGSIIQ
jgi:hypothetical protein